MVVPWTGYFRNVQQLKQWCVCKSMEMGKCQYIRFFKFNFPAGLFFFLLFNNCYGKIVDLHVPNTFFLSKGKLF